MWRLRITGNTTIFFPWRWIWIYEYMTILMTMTIIMMKMTIHLRHSSSSAVSTGAESSLSIPTKVGPIWSLPRWWWWSLWCWWWGTLQYGINSCFCEVIWLLTGWQGLIQGDAFYIVFEIALWGWTNEWMNVETKLQCSQPSVNVTLQLLHSVSIWFSL